MTINRSNTVCDGSVAQNRDAADSKLVTSDGSGQATADRLSEGQPKLDAHVVLLNNYIRPHHVAAYTALAKRVRELTVLLSVPMEPDRAWKPEWDGLQVRVQKNLMFTTRWKHSSGFDEPNFIHVPIDTTRQLKQLNADIVFSYEMGMRTLLSCWYRRFHRSVPLVMVGNMSEHVEAERGLLRRLLRRAICRGADYFTYNGPSCKRYLQSLSIPDEQLFSVPYCIDSDVVFDGKRTVAAEEPPRMLYCGALSERKGIRQFTEALSAWCQRNGSRQVTLAIAGEGPLKETLVSLARDNLTIQFLGQCDAADLVRAYASTDVAVFPSLADEWGLVPVEAMASGVPVLGSFFAQSVEAVCEEGKNGWLFDPTNRPDLDAAIDRALACSSERLLEMGRFARQSVAHVTPEYSADAICKIIQTALPNA